jgi:predicted AAA+ superfamily ATPase
LHGACDQAFPRRAQLREMSRRLNQEGRLRIAYRFSLSEGLIITENEEYVENVQVGEKIFKIIVIPIWKWLA